MQPFVEEIETTNQSIWNYTNVKTRLWPQLFKIMSSESRFEYLGYKLGIYEFSTSF